MSYQTGELLINEFRIDYEVQTTLGMSEGLLAADTITLREKEDF